MLFLPRYTLSATFAVDFCAQHIDHYEELPSNDQHTNYSINSVQPITGRSYYTQTTIQNTNKATTNIIIKQNEKT